MKSRSPTLLFLAMMTALPAAAQSNEALLKELQALQKRVTELEAKLKAQDAAKAPAPESGAEGSQPQWGMTPEQVADFNRIAAKTEAMEDGMISNGLFGLKLSGYIEPAFVYNSLQNRAGFQFLNQQSDGYNYDTSFIGAAVLDIQKQMEGGTLWHLTLAPNRGVGAAIDGSSIIQEASVSVPLEDQQTRFIAGQMPDWSGYEYQQPTLNPFTTHNLLYDFTLPLAYTGAGLDLKSGPWWVRTAIANVNQAIKANNEKVPSWAFRVDYAKGEFSGWGFASLIGKTPNYTTETNTLAFLAEADAFFTRGDLTLQGQISYGRQKDGAITPAADGSLRDAEWWGASGLFGYNFTPRLQGLVRADFIYNRRNGGGLFGYTSADGRNGIGPAPDGDQNIGANRYALTVGGKYLWTANTTVKLEYRLDGASQKVFEDIHEGGYKRYNQLLATSVVVAF